MIHEFTCFCGAVNDCITDPQRLEAVPHVGDFTLCFACGQIFCFDAEMVPIPSSIDELPTARLLEFSSNRQRPRLLPQLILIRYEIFLNALELREIREERVI